jgi:DNA-binding NarL/FixJ family response regulator
MSGSLAAGAHSDTVLLIDDDPGFAGQAAAALSDICTFEWSNTSTRVVEEASAHPPDLILLDLSMPRRLARVDEEEGLAVLEHLQGPPRRRVVVVSGAVSSAARMRLLALGVTGIYLKSESLMTLRTMVLNCMGELGRDAPCDRSPA